MHRSPSTKPRGTPRLHAGQRGAWLILAGSFTAYLLLSLPRSQAFHPWGSLAFFDLRVYRGAAARVLDGAALYGGPIWHWAPFTYPPFAAVVLAPLGLIPLVAGELLVTILGIAALLMILLLALRLPSGRTPEARHDRYPSVVVVPLAVAMALWLEPITSTLGYGQINLVIALLVVAELTRRDGVRTKGALLGIAAGIKLTPLIFVPYLLFSGRPRAAGTALTAFGATIATGYAVLPADSARFWGGRLFLDPQRVGGCCVPANQSLRGLILRLDPSFGSGRILAVALLVALAGTSLAIAASRRGDEATGFSLCALTGLLVSPVSWTHHWALLVPALALFAIRVVEQRSKLGIPALVALLIVGYSYSPKLTAKGAPAGAHPSAWWFLTAAPYVLIGCLALALALVCEIRGVTAVLAARRTAPRPSFHLAPIAPDLKGGR